MEPSEPAHLQIQQRRRVMTVVGCMAVLGIHYVLGLSATLNKCSAFDEILHIAGGYTYNRFNDFRLQPENGMLPQRWIALPLMFSNISFQSLEHYTWHDCGADTVGHYLFYENGNDASYILFVGRAMNGLWSLALGVLIFVWSDRLSGIYAAWLTLLLWAFSPVFLAHGFIATSDASAAFLFPASAGSLWAVLHRLTGLRLLACCAAMAGLFMSKYSAPIIIPIGLVLATIRLASNEPWRIHCIGQRILQARWQRFLAMLGLVILLVTTTGCSIWVGYAERYAMFNRSLSEDGIIEDKDSWETFLKNSDVITSVVRIARERHWLPEAYLYGFSYTRHYSHGRKAFFLGEFGTEGWRTFFPYCELVKTPTGTLLLLVVAGIAIFTRCQEKLQSERWAYIRSGLYRTAPLWVLFVFYWGFAINSHLNIGHRHLLPAEGPLLMFAGVAAWWWQGLQSFGSKERKEIRTTNDKPPAPWYRWIRVLPMSLAAGCAIATMFAALISWPNYLAFFNWPSGGPSQGWKKLNDSSLDWGQELPSLRAWLDKENLRSPSGTQFYLSYFGTGHPTYYGIQATMLPGFFDRREFTPTVPLLPGVYCISATMLQGSYSDFPGPWTDKFEREYQTLRILENAISDAAFVSAWAKFSESERLQWVERFRKYEQARLTRLTHTLRRRDPDAQVNYGMLIYRVSADELARALDGPVSK